MKKQRTNTPEVHFSGSIWMDDPVLALKLYDRFNELPTPCQFVASRMKITCITFKLPPLTAYGTCPDRVYRANTLVFRMVEVKARQDLSQLSSLCLVYPWLDALLGHEDTQNTELVESDVAEPSSPSIGDEDVSDKEVDGYSSSLAAPAYRRVAADGMITVQIQEKA